MPLAFARTKINLVLYLPWDGSSIDEIKNGPNGCTNNVMMGCL